MSTMTDHVGTASELQAGDFLDRTFTTEVTGPRGGKYRVKGYRVSSRIESVTQERSRQGPAILLLQVATGVRVPAIPDQRVEYRR